MSRRSGRMAIGGGGHPSVSDDGSGNWVLADGKRLLLGTGSTAAAPIISLTAAPTHGFSIVPGTVVTSVNGGDKMLVTGTVIQNKQKVLVSAEMVLSPTSDILITGTGSTIAPTGAPTKKISSDGVYTLSATIVAGADGQVIEIENVSANAVTLQEGPVCAQGTPIKMKYSSDQAVWEQNDN